MTNKIRTVKVSGGDYAKVADRLKKFREENPRASIKTTHEIREDGGATFTTYILKDKSDEFSADATGSAAYSAAEMKNAKAFEKLETISVGRALSLLGYLNNGEIASSEEMEEFEEFKIAKQQAAIKNAVKALESASNMDELRETFMNLNIEIRGARSVLNAKDEMKQKLESKNNGKEQK